MINFVKGRNVRISFVIEAGCLERSGVHADGNRNSMMDCARIKLAARINVSSIVIVILENCCINYSKYGTMHSSDCRID